MIQRLELNIVSARWGTYTHQTIDTDTDTDTQKTKQKQNINSYNTSGRTAID